MFHIIIIYKLLYMNLFQLISNQFLTTRLDFVDIYPTVQLI